MTRWASAVDAKCKVDGCGKNKRARGLCSMHSKRLRLHGDLNANLRKSDNDEVLLALIRLPSDLCISWTRTINHEGYPLIHRGGKTFRTNRVVCEMRHGKPPSESHHAAHSCGNRLCVNPAHIRWATPQENISDKAMHGTTARGEKGGSAVLSNSQVCDIKRRLHDGESQAQIGRVFGVSRHVINKISTGKNWGWLNANGS